MKKQIPFALAGAMVLACVSAATAGSMQSAPGEDAELVQHAAEEGLSDFAWVLEPIGPPGFNPVVGAVLPKSVATAPIMKKTRDVPALKPYDFSLAQHKVLIVNPTDKKTPR